MPSIRLFEYLPLWITYFGIVLLILGAVRSGIAIARRRMKRLGKEDDAPVNTVVGATLGLLAFILAFTFGMTTSRYDARKHFLLDEVNAIHTTWLRAELIPEPHQSEVRELLYTYVDLRLQLAKKEILPREAIEQSEGIQQKIWDHTVAIADMDHRNSSIVTLFTNSVNQLFEIQTKRVSVGLIDRIPTLIWAALFVLIVLAMFEVGFLIGRMEKTNWLLVLALSMAFSAVILIIVDLDTAKGSINVNHQAMFDLMQRLNN
jgi:hypothetical protein